MRISALLMSAALAAAAVAPAQAGSGMDQLRAQVKNKLPKYGITLTTEEVAALSNSDIVQIDQTMGDRDMRQGDKRRAIKTIVNR